MRESDNPNDMSEPSRDSKRSPTDAHLPPHTRPQSPGEDAGLSPELQSSEALWARLRPRGAELDRDRLFYQAGWVAAQAAGERRSTVSRILWPAALGGITAVAASLLALLLVRPEPGVVERVVYVERDATVNQGNQALQPAPSEIGARVVAGAEQNVWKAGQILRAIPLGSSQLASDLLPPDAARSADAAPPFAEPTILSSRSFDMLLDQESSKVNRSSLQNEQSPDAQESSHAL